ncbi:hypothetical protein BDV36DRAFT_51671 [Aspergillus pseudocaelatus]|uniref:Secreted protein n=1 Tax=Aspergillus pseudocaelatus TaxID=1825620 RepID=A0ABQ6WWN0_9EURO|nr:hypothetical protein BDV36DRAFT_51671 [Aspergillus pseudocaelatus]
MRVIWLASLSYSFRSCCSTLIARAADTLDDCKHFLLLYMCLKCSKLQNMITHTFPRTKLMISVPWMVNHVLRE